jgi:RNA polymerase sigma-70 factor (ECF subfamily)
MIAARRSRQPAPAPAQLACSFEEIYRLHGTVIHRFCLSQLQDPHLAEDATSDVFAIALGSFRQMDDDGGHLYWLLAIARRVVAGHRRGRLRQQSLSLRARHATASQQDIGKQVEVRDEVRRVTDAMAHLGRRDRVLVGLRVASQLSFGEIAEVMDISEGTARVATHRALKNLRARLEASR